MKIIRDVIGKHFREEIDEQETVRQLVTDCSPEELADFIVDAINRGWITNFNIGLDSDGNPI